MNFGVRSGIIVDVCREHGTWFDRGEYDAALGFVRDGGLEGEVLPPPSPNESAGTKLLLAELRAEAIRDDRAVKRVTDVLRVLFSLWP
jgi:hypothetical protein